MDLQGRLDELLRIAEEMDLVIRRVPLGGEGGGYCVVQGERRLFVDTMADLETRYEKTVEAMAQLPGIDSKYLRPELRDDIDQQKGAS